jgi:hypothetical protein
MPLTSADKPLFDNSTRSKIIFPMYDGGKIVRVVVSSRIPRKLAILDGNRALKGNAAFDKYRGTIEEAASRKYDAGLLKDGKVHVLRSDIWPNGPSAMLRKVFGFLLPKAGRQA